MRIGIGMGVTGVRRGAAAWSPAALPRLAAPIVSLMRSAGTLWQDDDETLPALDDGDPVYVAYCTFTGVRFAAPGPGARPLLYDEGGGVWSLSGDGADDGLGATLDINGLAAFTTAIRAIPQSNDPDQFVTRAYVGAAETGSWGGLGVTTVADGRTLARVGTGGSNVLRTGTATLGADTRYTTLFEFNGTAQTQKAWRDGVLLTPVDSPVVGTVTQSIAATVWLLRGHGGSQSAEGRLAAAVLYAGLRSEELEAYLGGF